MDFVDEVRALASKIPGMLDHIFTEAATRTALVEPFIRALGYDTSNPAEVVPEFGANLHLPGVHKDKHVDYGILENGQPIILIEVKPYGKDPSVGLGQLFNYFTTVDARLAIATNGVIYRFYTDLEKKHLLDKTPFLEIDMLNLDESRLVELKKLTKSALDISGMVQSANELKFVGGILNILTQQASSTDEEFAEYFFRQLCPNKNFQGGVRQQFATFTQKALNQFVREQIKSLLDVTNPTPVSTSNNNSVKNVVIEPDPNSTNKVVTTPEEMEAFYIAKSILRGMIETERIGYKDVQNYFTVLLDSKVTQPICRFYFNNPQNMRLSWFSLIDGQKQEEKVAITNLDEIYQYAEKLKATVAHYEKK